MGELSLEAALDARRANLAFQLSVLCVVSAAILVPVGVAKLAPGVPPPGPLLVGMAFVAAIGAGARRGSRLATRALPWFIAVAVPLLIVEPGLTSIPDFSFLIAPLAALVLADAATLWATGYLPILILIARCPEPSRSPYLDVSLFIVVGVMVGGMWLAQRTLRSALKAVFHRQVIEGAAARAGADIVVWTDDADADPELRYVSPSATVVLGHSLAAPGGSRSSLELVHPEDHVALGRAWRSARAGADGAAVAEFRVLHADGRWIWMQGRLFDLRSDPAVLGVVACLRDITHERRAREEHSAELLFQAHHDPLTGLPNRRRLMLDLDALATRSGRSTDLPSWICFCDVDAFHGVHDSLGHDVGDALLLAVTTRLQEVVGSQGLYRFGGDELVVLVVARSEDDVRELAARIVTLGDAPLQAAGQRLFATLSVGVARVARDTSPADALRDADLAMHAAKVAGRNRLAVFDDSMRKQAERRHAVGHALRDALRAGELSVAYQPKVESGSQRCVGFEALARWSSPTLGVVSPAEFIPIAEESGLVSDLFAFVLGAACREFADWHAEGLMVSVSVNVSGAQLSDPERLIEQLRTALGETSLPPELLDLEITESAAASDADRVLTALESVRALGVGLSLDDFGTGYSSLAYIRRFPATSLKIDRSFVVEMRDHRESRAILAAVVALAQELNLETVAEGVETEAQRAALAQLGVDLLQGYLFAKPLSRDDAHAFARTRGGWQSPARSRRGEQLRGLAARGP